MPCPWRSLRHLRQNLIQPGSHLIKHRFCVALAMLMTFLRRQFTHLLFHPVQLLDQRQPTMRLAAFLVFALRLDRFTEAAPGMGHATDVYKIIADHDGVVSIVSIRL